MKPEKPKTLRCAVYTRKSSEEGLDQSFNSLDAQREACEAFIKSQAHEGWTLVPKHYDDGGISGGTMERPGLKALLVDIDAGKVDIIVVYKVDRLTRSLADFAKIVEVLDAKGASFVSVTQQFNTTTSMGRLTLNVLLSFAQFEREVTGERIRDKVAASKKKGMWMGGFPPLGYDILNRKLAVNAAEAKILNNIFERFLALGSVRALVLDLGQRKIASKRWKTRKGRVRGGQKFSRGALYYLLRNRVYLGEIAHNGQVHPGEHRAILDRALWERAQALLDRNVRGDPKDPRSRGGYLLSGLLFDDRGNRMTPSHVKKRNGQRYRYYLSQALLQHRPADAGTLPRIAAPAIEALIADRLGRIRPDNVNDGDAAAAVRKTIARVEVARDRVTVMLAADASHEELQQRLPAGDTLSNDGGALRIVVPIQLRNWGGETVIEGPNGTSATAGNHLDTALIAAITKAHAWKDDLATGKAASFRAIALKAGCTEGYVRHIVALAFLAPEITAAILRGTQPRQLTVDRLVRADIPMRWQQQRAMFGLAA
nr:recombinase family protein [Nitrosomonas nitrosa]